MRSYPDLQEKKQELFEQNSFEKKMRKMKQKCKSAISDRVPSLTIRYSIRSHSPKNMLRLISLSLYWNVRLKPDVHTRFVFIWHILVVQFLETNSMAIRKIKHLLLEPLVYSGRCSMLACSNSSIPSQKNASI